MTTHRSIIRKSATGLVLVAAAAVVGCAPQGGQKVSQEVVEIEAIEMVPTTPAATDRTADGEAARQAMDAEKAATPAA